MIPAAFDYVRADSLSQAIELLAANPDGAKLVAGGHTLIPTLKLRLASPALLIDISRIAQLKGIEVGEQIKIGALTTHAELLASEPLRQAVPLFHQAADLISDPQVRNRGTIGGSLANADPAADWPAIVIALNATFEIAGPDGVRQLAAKDFFVNIMTSALGADEVLTAIRVARPSPDTRFAYRKIRHPASGYAVVGVAVAMRMTGDAVTEITIGVTGAAGFPFPAEGAAEFLTGKLLSAENIDAAVRIASENIDYQSDLYAPAAYRRQLVKTEIGRALSGLRDRPST
jgi:aerobic carbon-monoxide dehydrogenase medium subunit